MNEVIQALEKALAETKTALAIKPLSEEQVDDLEYLKRLLEAQITDLKSSK